MPGQIQFTIDINRFNARMQRFIATEQREAERAVFETAITVLADIQDGWPVDTGVSRASWSGPRKVKALTYQLSNAQPYAPVIEYGGYPGVGPKTEQIGPTTFEGGIQVGGGIFPSQKPHAPVRRSLSKNRDELFTRLAASLRRTWGR